MASRHQKVGNIADNKCTVPMQYKAYIVTRIEFDLKRPNRKPRIEEIRVVTQHPNRFAVIMDKCRWYILETFVGHTVEKATKDANDALGTDHYRWMLNLINRNERM